MRLQATFLRGNVPLEKAGERRDAYSRPLPLHSDMPLSAMHHPGDADPTTTSAPSLRVLVVEDDPATLGATVEMLELLGHWVAGVKSAEVARDRFIEGAFDVLMTDIGLPALSGLDLVEILQAHHKLRVIFATGQPPPENPIPGTVWLQKPFGVEALQSALHGSERQSL